MIELSVSLASNGAVKVPGYEQLLRFGYTKNRGVYRLAVTPSGEWAGLEVRAFWHVPGGKDPASSLVADGYLDVPASVTAQPGDGCITFEGSDGSKTVTSADLRYRVSSNSGTEEGDMPEPDSPSWEQFVDAVKDSAKAARQAAQDAAGFAESADTFAGDATESAQKASSSADAAEKFARAASESRAEAARQAELAAQAAKNKGYMYLEDDDNSGTLSFVKSDNLTDDVMLQDDGHGVLEVVYL